MPAAMELKIDTAEQFPHLPGAPIVEAVIEIRTRAEAPWEEGTTSEKLKAQVGEYPQVRSERAGQLQLTFTGKPEAEQSFQDLGWRGLQFKSADERQIAAFTYDRFVFSRLPPYQNWDVFQREAMRLWRLHEEVARPKEAQRIGVRFINRIVLPPEELLFEDYICRPPQPPKGLDLPYHGFLHQETLAVPGYPYALNVTRTIQTPPDQPVAIILDIDVFTVGSLELQAETLARRLLDMRWLKNKVFFGSVTDKALDKFKQ